MYKLIAIDIDGTLINDKHEVTTEVYNAVHAAKAKGVKIVLCSGRPIGGVRRYLDELDLNQEGDYVISYNGAFVQNTFTNDVVSELSLGFEDLKMLYELSLDLKTFIHFYDNEHIYTLNKDVSKYTVLESYLTQIGLHYRELEEIPKNILLPKVSFSDDPEDLDKVIAAIPTHLREKYTMVRSSSHFYEFLHPDASKGNAVKQLAERLGIEQHEVMSIGDNGNDLTMIEYAGCGVAMENGIPELKEIANFQTLSNNENGVAVAIQKFVLTN